MSKTFRAKATLILQFMAGQDIEYVEVDGKVFVLLPTPELSAGVPKSKPAAAPAEEDDDEEPKAKSKAKAKADEPEEKTAPAKLKIHKEEKLMEMDNKELKKLCEEMKIDFDSYEGKNTSRKLTNLILEKQDKLKAAAEKAAAKASASDYDDDDEKPAAKSKKADKEEPAAKGSKKSKQVEDIVTALDEGDLTESKAIAKLLDINEDADKKALKKVVGEFMEDADAPKPKFVKAIVAILEGEAPEEDDDDEDEKPAPKGKAKGKEEVLTDAEDLEEDQEVSVYWASDKKWYSGVVKKVSKKGILIAYEDGEDEFIDADEHTKIKVVG